MPLERLRLDPLVAKLIRHLICLLDADAESDEENLFEVALELSSDDFGNYDCLAGPIFDSDDDANDLDDELCVLMFGFVSHMMGKSRPSVEFSHPPLETPWDTLNDTVFEENCRIRRADFETMCSKLIIPTDAEGDVITNTR